MRRLAIVVLGLTIWVSSCKKKTAPSPPPQAAVLQAPARNEACLVSNSGKVQFTWLAAANTDSYELTVTNLLTQAVQTQNSTLPSVELTLNQNTPYSWFVTSKSVKSTSIAKSDVWRFYSTGPGVASYAPFPAVPVSPGMNQAISASGGKVTLSWTGSDVDNDITTYDIYLGTTSTPVLLQSGLTASNLPNITVSSNTRYFWKIITKDAKGHTSDSGIYQFYVN